MLGRSSMEDGNKLVYQSGRGIDFDKVNNKQNFVLSKTTKNLFFKANASSSINKEEIDIPESVNELSNKLVTSQKVSEVPIELPVHKIKRVLDEMVMYRDYLKETVEKQNLKIMDVKEEKKCLEELEVMITATEQDIRDQGFDPVSLEILLPNNGINAEEYKRDFQVGLDGELETKLKEIDEIEKKDAELGDLQKEVEFELVSNQKREFFQLNSQIDLLNKRIDDIQSFLGDDSKHILQKNHENLVEEVAYWYSMASILDRHGLKDLSSRIAILDKEIDTVSSEKRMNFMNGDQRKELEETLKEVEDPTKIKQDVEMLMERMQKDSSNIELMAKIALKSEELKETVESIAANTTNNSEVLKTLEENLEANQKILEQNLNSFEERIKKLQG